MGQSKKIYAMLFLVYLEGHIISCGASTEGPEPSAGFTFVNDYDENAAWSEFFACYAQCSDSAYWEYVAEVQDMFSCEYRARYHCLRLHLPFSGYGCCPPPGNKSTNCGRYEGTNICP